MATKAAIAFAKLYSVDLARRFNFRVSEHHLQQAHANESELEEFALIVGQNAARFNKGMMSQMQENPASTVTECYINTALTNQEILVLADFEQYVKDGTYDSAAFFDLFKVMNIKFVAELESCSYNEFLIALDGMLSNVPQAAAAFVNFATQAGTGFQNGDTSIFIAADYITEGMEDDNNWETFGQGFQLFLAQLLKISAGETSIDVSPVGV